MPFIISTTSRLTFRKKGIKIRLQGKFTDNTKERDDIMKKLLSLVLTLGLILSSFAVANAEAESEEPVTIRLLRTEQTFWFPEGEDIRDNVLTRFMEEKLNCKFDVVWTTDNYETTLNMMIASNSLPDFFEASVGQMSDLYEFGLIQPVGQYFDEYLSDAVKQEILWNNNTQLIGCTFDEEYYGFPCTSDFMDDLPVLYIRQDWLDKLNLEFDPSHFTLDDFITICDAFTNMDPDGNGQNDTFALALNEDSVGYTGIRVIGHALGLHTNIWEKDEDGSFYFTDNRDEIKPVLKIMQDMYAKGYIAKDYISANVTEQLSSGKCGMEVGVFWQALSEPQTVAKADPSVKWVVYPIPQNPEGGYNMQTEVHSTKFLTVNSEFEHPELAVKYMQLWYEMWRGEYSDYYHGLNATTYNEVQEDFKFYPPFWWDPPLKNAEISNKLVKALETGDDSYIEGDAEAGKILPHIRSYLAGEEDWYGFAQYYNHIQAIQTVHKYYGSTDASKYTFNLMGTVPMDSDYAGIKSLLDDLHDEYFNKIVMGADLDSTFAEYQNQWVATGGDELTEYYNDWYAANGAAFE